MTQNAPSDFPPPANVTPSYRRNGKLQSCEPCRKGKLRCDHAMPTCGRCARRGKIEACIYHPAPLTKPRASPALSARVVSSPPISKVSSFSTGPPFQQTRTDLVTPPTTSSESIPASSTGARGFRSGVAPLSAVISESPQLSNSSLTRRTSSSDLMPVKDNKTGFLGSSAFSAVFTENNKSLGIEPPEIEQRIEPHVPIPPEMIHRGAEILTLFRDIRIFEVFLTRWFEVCDGITIIRPIYGVWIRGIQQEFDAILSQHERVEDLYGLSELVWRNTQHSITVDGTTSTLEWGARHTGRHLRWETLGALCSAVGLIAIDMSEYDSAFNSARAKGIAKDKRTMTETIRKAIEEVLAFCRYCETTTDVYVCNLYESVLLLESLRGDAYSGAWHRMGEVVDTVISLGYHQEKRADVNTPFYIAELRTRLFDQIYGHDKNISTFLGRPPRLSHRYCVTQLPLDLSDEELCLQGAELQTAISRLNDGWNSDNRFRRSTWRRVWAQHARIREDILEIVLGTSVEGMATKAEKIRGRIRQTNDSMPEFVKADVIEILNNMHSDVHPLVSQWERERIPLNTMNLVWIHGGIIHTEFLLERSLVNRLKSSDVSALIPKARALLTVILAAVSKRDQMRDFTIDMIALLVAYGLPAAGVIGVEMLKQEQTREYTPDILPRSKVIQDLSVFVSALATVSPGEGNYTICDQGRKVLEKILDKILSPQPHQPATGIPHNDLGNDTSLYFPTGNDAEFMQWLDNLEWERGSLFNQ